MQVICSCDVELRVNFSSLTAVNFKSGTPLYGSLFTFATSIATGNWQMGPGYFPFLSFLFVFVTNAAVEEAKINAQLRFRNISHNKLN